MNNYCALLIDNVVNQIVVGDYDWTVANIAGTWYDLGGDPLTVGIGYTYDPDLDQFFAPAVPDETE